jgi:hypothetical protein
MNENKSPKKKSLLFRVGWAIFFIFFILLLISITIQIVDMMTWTNFFKKPYSTEIKPKGEAEINKILYNVSNISDTRQKFNEIAKWELEGFESYHWAKTSYCMYPTQLSKVVYEVTCPLLPLFNCCFFQATKTGKIRVLNTFWPINLTPYSDNPYWIAYYKTGACEELAVLFNFVANKSGNETRTVNSLSHAWVEVKIDNEWWYFDPLCYKVRYNQDELNETKWFNQTRFFKQNCYDEMPPIFVRNTGEFIGYHYPDKEISSPKDQIEYNKEWSDYPMTFFPNISIIK